MNNDLCKTCVKLMDICHKKDALAKLNMIWGDAKAYILRCDRYEKRNVKEEDIHE